MSLPAFLGCAERAILHSSMRIFDNLGEENDRLGDAYSRKKVFPL